MEKTYKALEFNKILDKLSAYTENERVREELKSLPQLKFDEAVMGQKETSEAVSTLLKLGNPPVSFFAGKVTSYAKRA